MVELVSNICKFPFPETLNVCSLANGLRASRANAHSENKDEAALPVHRAAVGLCAT